MNPFEVSVNLSLKVNSINVYHGTSEKGNSYIRYFMDVQDPVSGKEFSFSFFAIDGKNPPEVGTEYPLVIRIQRRRFELTYDLRFPTNMVS